MTLSVTQTGTMRAVIVPTPGGIEALTIAHLPVPTPAPDQVLVRVRAAALNHADMLQRAGEFPAPPGESDVLGVEIAGDVVACGDRVAIAPGSPVFGLVGGGAYADFCLLDAQMAIPVPIGFSYAQAAALPEVFFTADTTMFGLGGLTAGQSVLVHAGGSGLGSACIQMARRAGARVACTVGSAAKIAPARALGADLVVDHTRQDFVREVLEWTGGEGVDLVEDVVGADYFERNLAVLKDGGCLMQVGVMSGTKCALDLDTIVLRRLQVKGSVMRMRPIEAKRAITRRFVERWLPELVSGAIVPVVAAVISLADVARAHAMMERREHFGKIILDVDDAAGVVAVGAGGSRVGSA
jgi:putative PIG3 family NAD(P)H quinone oxidoreductase